jgi:GH18 family chitinase
MRSLRAALDEVEPGYQLTYAVTGYVRNYDAKAISKAGAADAVYIMGYHYRGTWSQIAGSTAPLGGEGYDLAETIAEYAKLVPRDEILVGLPYYGHEWNTATNKVHARTTSPGRDVLYAEAIAIAERNGLRYDKTEQTAWTVWKAGGGWRQLYFDDALTLGTKWDYVKRQKLLGSGIWAVGFEQAHTELNDVLRSRFVP